MIPILCLLISYKNSIWLLGKIKKPINPIFSVPISIRYKGYPHFIHISSTHIQRVNKL